MMTMNYAQEQAIGLAGALADLTVKVTDSFSAEEDMTVGLPVIRGTVPDKQCKLLTVEGACLGITQHVHKEQWQGVAYYPTNYTVPVVTKGRVYVNVDGAVVAGTPAKYDKTNKVWSASAGVAVSNVKFVTSTSAKGIAVVEIA